MLAFLLGIEFQQCQYFIMRCMREHIK